MGNFQEHYVEESVDYAEKTLDYVENFWLASFAKNRLCSQNHAALEAEQAIILNKKLY